MKVVNFCYDDYANFMYWQTEAMRSVGMNVSAYKLKSHPFEYEKQCEVVIDAQLRTHLADADIIQVFHSQAICLPFIHKYAPKAKITVWHTGSIYRRDPFRIKDSFRHSFIQFTDQCEFLSIDSDLKYVATAINTGNLSSSRLFNTPYKVGHFPSNPEVKGTDDIVRMVREVNDGSFIFDCQVNQVPHHEQLKRIAGCDIYIELYKLELGGQPYGCHGVTAFEAAAMGKLVITQNIHLPAYEQAYQTTPPLYFAHTPDRFRELLKALTQAPPYAMEAISKSTRAWVEKYHSLQATGMRVKKIIEEFV